MQHDPEDAVFEDEVRRIARELWPSAQYDGASNVYGQERDGVFETEECFHLLEATSSRRKDKAQKDVGKMVTLAQKYQKRQNWKAVKCWFVTKDEPTADQRSVAENYRGLVSMVSYSQFQSKLIDVRTYLSLRDKYPFGSVRDPGGKSITPSVEYIPLDMVEITTNLLWSSEQVINSIISNGKFILLGDYGAGKSMTLRKIYQELKKQYLRNKLISFPVFINLRDHFGQTNASEILERHARLVGFPNPSHLVRAWRAGYTILLIDGIDEITTIGMQGFWKKLQDIRFRAMQGIRELVRDHPNNSGIILAGRAHFFDSDRERVRALGLTNEFHQLNLGEFTDEQIKKYLELSGLAGNIPSWFPTRPLLIGYLASKSLLDDIINTNIAPDNHKSIVASPIEGWDLLLDKICFREALIEAGIDGLTVRKILERLATIARAAQDGLGPLTPEQIVEAFRQICGYSPDEKGMLLLQRLPGLGIDRNDEETRKFIDEGFVDVCRAGDIVEFIEHPYSFETSLFENAENSMKELGVGVASLKLTANDIKVSKANASFEFAYKNDSPATIRLDLSSIFIFKGWKIDHRVVIDGVTIADLTLDSDMPDISNLEFRNCFFSQIVFTDDLTKENLPKFRSCYVSEIEGRMSINDIPKELFDDDCIIESFLGTEKTTKALINLDLPLGAKVLLTILKKLYLQKGSGRKEKALVSGLDHHARRLVPDILRIVQSEDLVIPYKRGTIFLWLPNRNYSARVSRILSAPSESNDMAMMKCRELV